MSERLSTGFRNWLLGGGSYRTAFEDGVMKIYSGTAPSTADAAVTGTLLVTITKSSGTVSTTERSTPNKWKISIPDSHAEAATVIVNVTVDGVGPTSYTYTNTPDAGDAEAVMVKVARMLDDIPQIKCIALGSGIVARTAIIEARVAGIALTIADGTGTITITPTEITSAVRSDALYFAVPASGEMAKSTDTWSGVVASDGVAGYFRIVQPDDDGTLSTTQMRLQGTVSTSGAELNMSNTSLTASTTHTVDDYSITVPAE